MSIRENIIIWPTSPKQELEEIQIDQHTYMTVEPEEKPKKPVRRKTAKRSEGSE